MWKTRKNKPLDTAPPRYQTLSVTLLVSAAYLPLAFHLNWRISAFLLLLLVLRLASLKWPSIKPGRLALALLMIAGILNCLLAYGTPTGQMGGSALFVTMLGLKLHEVHSRRDLRVAGILLWFMVVVHFLFSQSVGLAIYLAILVLLGIALQVDLNGAMRRFRLRAALGFAGTIGLQALPLTLILFLFFPRLNAPLWNFGVTAGTGTTGMSDRLEPGAISELVINGELAFRVRFDTKPPIGHALFWRGPVLWEAGERGWYRGPAVERHLGGGRPLLRTAGDEIAYEVSLEPSGQRWMFSLDVPTAAPSGSSQTTDFQILSARTIDSPTRYRLVSAMDYRTEDPPPALREYALRLPDNISRRVLDLAQGWRAVARSDWDVVEAALNFFHQEDFHYTLLPAALGANPTDQFLFETRQGFCEHYASSFAILMRAAGIPTRLVTGYAGGERNPIGDYFMVWQSDAHAWVEVSIPGRGWVRVDPTAAIDPSRIDNRSASRLLGGTGSPANFQIDSGEFGRLFKHLRLFADSIEMVWQSWVLDFSTARQWSMLEALGLAQYRTLGLLAVLLVSGSLVMGIVLIGLLHEPKRFDPVEACFQELCRKLSVAGLAREPFEGPADYCERVARMRPELAEAVLGFLNLYLPARYSARRVRGAERGLRERLGALHVRKR